MPPKDVKTNTIVEYTNIHIFNQLCLIQYFD